MKTEWSDLKEEKISQEDINYFDSQENNIFRDAKFGDKFVTRDRRIAILISLSDIAVLAVEITKPGYMRFLQIECDLNGNINNRYIPNSYDIVSRYKEPIDEEKLSKYAFEECPYEVTANPKAEIFFEGFYSGYRKAKEE